MSNALEYDRARSTELGVLEVLTTKGWRPKTLCLELNHPINKGKIILQIFGSKGGFNEYIGLTPEEAWILGDMLIEESIKLIDHPNA